MTKIFVASDHAGFDIKSAVLAQLTKRPLYQVMDLGVSDKASVDYPDFADKTVRELMKVGGDDPTFTSHFGLLICGTGQGMAIRANRHRGIRAALCWNTEIAALAREHNNANVLCLPGRYIDEDLAWQITEKFLTTEFAGGRHSPRVMKLEKPL